MPQKLKLQYYEMEKNMSPSTLESKRNKIIKNSKGLIIGVVKGKSVFCQLKKVFGLKKKKSQQFLFFGIPMKDKSFQ